MAAGMPAIQADLTQYLAEPFNDRVIGMWASPPCFAAGTPVVSGRGLVPIEDIEIGDIVLTHLSRWQRVTATMSRQASVVRLSNGTVCTPDHPYLSRLQEYRQSSQPKPRKRLRFLTDEAWRPASRLKGVFVASPMRVEPLNVPAPPIESGEDFWWMVGRWLGDGWVELVRSTEGPPKQPEPFRSSPEPCLGCNGKVKRCKRKPGFWNVYCSDTCATLVNRKLRPPPRGEVGICAGKHEADELAKRLDKTGHWRRDPQRTTERFSRSSCCSGNLVDSNFGNGSAGKTLPGWASAWMNKVVLPCC